MLVNWKRFFAVLLISALLTGVFTCTQSIPSSGIDEPQPPSTAATEPATAPSTQPDPLPPSAGPTLQQATMQPPAWKFVTLPSISAKEYFVYDVEMGDFLYISDNTTKQMYPASTTKLFTTYVALQYLSPDDVITVGSELNYVAWDASRVGFQKGDQVSVKTLAYGALLPSGCDASYILAAAAGRAILGQKNATAKNAIAAFMEECNRMAKDMGMKKTHLVTPDGYHDPDHKISLQAFVIIGKACLENRLIAKIVSTASTTVSYTKSSGKSTTVTLKNTNYIIHSDNKYYNGNCIGLKTGFTNAAGYCLLTAYKVNGRYVLIGVFGCKESNDRFKDANKLFDAYRPYL